jgi:hypothetical protein
VPTSNQPVVYSNIPANLGYCIKADQILWLERHIQALIDAEQTGRRAHCLFEEHPKGSPRVLSMLRVWWPRPLPMRRNAVNSPELKLGCGSRIPSIGQPK